MSTSRFAVGMSCAVFALALVSSAFGRTVSASVAPGGGGMPVGLAVSFGVAQEGEVNSLFIAYGNTDGGTTTNGWEKVRRVNFVSSDGVTGSVVVDSETTSCVVPLPDDFGESKFARVFLFAGETGVPYETRYDSMISSTTSSSGDVNEGGMWIDAGVVPNLETSIRIVFKTSSGQPMFGVRDNFYCFGNNSTTTYFGFHGYNSSGVSAKTSDGKQHTICLGKDGAILDGKSLGVPTPTETPVIGSIILFGRSNNVTPRSINRFAAGTIYEADILESGRAIRSFVGVQANGVNCLYDCVEGRLYYSHDDPASTYKMTAGTLVSTTVAESEQVAVSDAVSTDAAGISFESVTVEDQSVTFGWIAGTAGDVYAILTERDTQTATTNLLQTAAERGTGSASLTLPYNVPYSARLLLTVGNELAESVDRSFDMPIGDIRKVRAWKSMITFPGFTATETLTDFPALVKLAKGQPLGFDPADCAAGGADLLFTDEDGNFLSYEIDTWDPEGTSFVWVSVPELSAGTSVALYWKDIGQRVAQGNAPVRVWKDYIGVWHLNEQSGTAIDATGHGLDGTPKGTRASESVGAADGAVGVARRNVNTGAGAGSRIEVPSYSAFGGATQFTISGFFKRNGKWQGEREQYPRILARQGTAYDGWGINLSNVAGGYSVRGANSTPAASVPSEIGPTLETWGHLAVVYDGSRCSFYGNGANLLDNETIASAADNRNVLAFGSRNDGGDNSFDGWMDEIRLYNGVMSPLRASAEYATMGANDAFTAYGSAESTAADGSIRVTSVATEDRMAKVGGLLLDAEGNPVTGATVTVSCGPDAEHLEPQAESVTTADDGSFSIVLAPLKPRTTYAYRLEASGPVSCGTPVLSLTTTLVARRCRFKKCELAFPGYVAALALNDFPVLVRLAEGHPAGFSYADCATGGVDLLATDEANNPLDLEIETWDPSGESLVWVRVPKLTVDSRVRLYWGLRDDAPEVEPSDPTGVWRGYTGVWHLDEPEGTAVDKTGHGLDGVPSGEAAAQMVVTNDAVLGGARVNVNNDFASGKGSYLLIPSYDEYALGSHFTASGFFKLTRDTWPGIDSKGAASGIYPRLFSRGGNYDNSSCWFVNLSVNPGQYTIRGRGTEGTGVDDGPMLTNTWAHITVVFDGNESSFYADGELVETVTVPLAPFDGNQPLAIGCRNNGADHSFGGLLDEIRLAPGSATPQRVKAEYDTMMNNAAFTAYGATEPSSGAGLVFDRLEAVSAEGGVTIEGIVLCDDAPAAGVTVSLSLGTDPAALQPYAGTATTDEKGAFHIMVGDLVPDTTYYYQATAERGAASLTADVRRFKALGASGIIETAFAVRNHTLVCSGAVRLGAGETTVVLLVGESPDAVTRETVLKTFAAGTVDGSFSEEFDMSGLPGSYYKIICRNTSGASSWSDETQRVLQQFPTDQNGAAYTWVGGASGVWNDEANWQSLTGKNGWPYTAASAASFPAAAGAIEVTSVPNASVRELSFERGAEVGFAVDAGATLKVTSDPLLTNGTLTVKDTALHLTGGRLACEAISFIRTADAKPCSITVSDGGELWLGGSATMATGSHAELHVFGTGSVQLGRPNDGNALWQMGTDSKMFLGSSRSEVRKAFGVARALLEVTNGVHGGTIKFIGNAFDNVVRVSGPTAAATGALRLFDSQTTRNNLVLVEKGALLAPVDDVCDVYGTSNIVRIVDATMRCESFGTVTAVNGEQPAFAGVSNRGRNSGIEFCGTTPKLTVDGAWISGNSSGTPVVNAAHLIFSVSGAGYAAEPIEVKGLATVYSNTVFEVRVAKGSTQARIPLMKVASTPWAPQGDLKAAIDGLNAVAVLPEGARLVVSKDGKTLYCKRSCGLVLFVR